jgi:hypothetical protein
MSETTTKTEAASTFGMLSIAAPFIGGFIILILFWTDLIAPLLYIRIAFGALVFSPALIGVAFAIGAWMRGERNRRLRYIGLILNLAILIFFVILMALPHSGSAS